MIKDQSESYEERWRRLFRKWFYLLYPGDIVQDSGTVKRFLLLCWTKNSRIPGYKNVTLFLISLRVKIFAFFSCEIIRVAFVTNLFFFQSQACFSFLLLFD